METREQKVKEILEYIINHGNEDFSELGNRFNIPNDNIRRAYISWCCHHNEDWAIEELGI